MSLEIVKRMHVRIPRLITRKELPVPTVTGWCAAAVVAIVIAAVGISSIHTFLAPVAPINGEALIIEGWLPDYCLAEAAALVKKERYRYLFVTGGPLENGSYLKEYRTYAALGAATMKELSIPDSIVVVVPAGHSTVNRTWASAVALKNWLDSTGVPVTRFDLCSQSTHARRSRLLFRKALQKPYAVGVIALPDRDYPPEKWWKTSEGVRGVVDELVAYIYALLFITGT